MKLYHYSIRNLVNALIQDNNCLDGISCSIANNKTRKISKPCILNVKKYLHTIGTNEI